MEISDNNTSILIDIDKLTFKKATPQYDITFNPTVLNGNQFFNINGGLASTTIQTETAKITGLPTSSSTNKYLTIDTANNIQIRNYNIESEINDINSNLGNYYNKTQLDPSFSRLDTHQITAEAKFAEIDASFTNLDAHTQFTEIDVSFARLDAHQIVAEAKFAEIDTSFTNLDAHTQFTEIDVSFSRLDAHQIAAEAKFTEIDSSFVTLDNYKITTEDMFIEIDTSFVRLDAHQTTTENKLTEIDSSFVTLDNYKLITGHMFMEIDASFVRLDAHQLVAQSKFSYIDTSFVTLDNHKISTDMKLNEIDTSFVTLDNHKISTDMKLNEIDTSFVRLDTHKTTTETKLGEIDTSFVRLDTHQTTTEAKLGEIDTSFVRLDTHQTTTEAKLGVIDTSFNRGATGLYINNNTIELPPNNPLHNQVMTYKNNKLEWTYNQTTLNKNSSVEVENLNVYGSADISGNIRVTSEVDIAGALACNDLTVNNTLNINEINMNGNIVRGGVSQLEFDKALVNNIETDTANITTNARCNRIEVDYLNFGKTNANCVPTGELITSGGVKIKFL